MTPNDVKLVLHDVLGGGVFLNTSAFIVMVCGWLVATALAAGVGAFYGKRGETAAVKRDLKTIIDNLRETTAATEAIKTDIAGGLWVEQSRWTFKARLYKELLESFGVMASCLNQLATVESLRTTVQHHDERAHLEDLEKQYDQQASTAFGRIIKCEAVARAWLGREGLEALDTFAENWPKAFAGAPGIDRTRRLQAAAAKAHGLLYSVVQDDLQLRRTR